MTRDEQKFYEIFFPYAHRREITLRKDKMPLVHYTTAESAMQIISTKRLWMRLSSCMNDTSEGVHGTSCVVTAYNGVAGMRLKAALARVSPHIASEVERHFNAWVHHFQTDTYLACFSEHDEAKENVFGRLSMWRAYSERTGVALVLNSGVFFDESEHFKGLFTSPVAYLDNTSFTGALLEVAEKVEDNLTFLQRMEEDDIINSLFRALMFASLCTKHPGFEEEKEWRLTYCPSFEATPNLEKVYVSVKGIPQTIYKIPLENVPSVCMSGLSINELVSRVIIGPTSYPIAMRNAFIELLGLEGVTDPASRVFISGIPLR